MGMGVAASTVNMRTLILSLVVVAVSGDAKPWTVAQVAAGEPVKNAIAEGRLHNIGVITNAAEAGVTHVGAVPLSYHGGYVPTVPQVYYGKREAEAEPYTLAQVAAGQTAGGLITAIDYGHNTGLRPVVPALAQVKAVSAVSAVPAVYSHIPYISGIHYGKREADPEPYTIGQVAAGQTNGGVITSVGGVPVVPHRAPVSVYNVPHTPLVYNHPVYYSNFLG